MKTVKMLGLVVGTLFLAAATFAVQTESPIDGDWYLFDEENDIEIELELYDGDYYLYVAMGEEEMEEEGTFTVAGDMEGSITFTSSTGDVEEATWTLHEDGDVLQLVWPGLDVDIELTLVRDEE